MRTVVRTLTGGQASFDQQPAGAKACDRCTSKSETLYEVVKGKWYMCPGCAGAVLRQDYREGEGQ